MTLGIWSCALALQDPNGSLPHSAFANCKRSESTGLARHSAMTKGSLPSAAKSSRNTSGCLLCCAIRSISACNCSGVIGFCHSCSSNSELRRYSCTFWSIAAWDITASSEGLGSGRSFGQTRWRQYTSSIARW